MPKSYKIPEHLYKDMLKFAEETDNRVDLYFISASKLPRRVGTWLKADPEDLNGRLIALFNLVNHDESLFEVDSEHYVLKYMGSTKEKGYYAKLENASDNVQVLGVTDNLEDATVFVNLDEARRWRNDMLYIVDLDFPQTGLK